MTVPQRCTNLAGEQSYLESGVQMAMAIAPPDTAARILLVSDGNETSGDLRQVARSAAANHIPIDVLPLRFKHLHDVVFSRLAAPLKAHSGQTITLRLVLNSTSDNVGGLLHLTLNGKALAIDPPNVDDARGAPRRRERQDGLAAGGQPRHPGIRGDLHTGRSSPG